MLDVLQTEFFQHASHFNAILHVVGETFQWFQILLRSTVSHIGQMSFDLFDAFLVQLFAQNGKLLLQIACKRDKKETQMNSRMFWTTKRIFSTLPIYLTNPAVRRSHSFSSNSDESESGSSASLESAFGSRLEPECCDSAPDISSSPSLSFSLFNDGIFVYYLPKIQSKFNWTKRTVDANYGICIISLFYCLYVSRFHFTTTWR